VARAARCPSSIVRRGDSQKRRSSPRLRRRVRRHLSFREAASWHIDRIEIEEALGDALLSVCQTPPEARTALLAWLDARIAALGGPVEEAYRQRGHSLARVQALLELTRVRKLLAAAIDAAERDCPFWLEPRADFAGRQIADDRWQLELAGGGKGILGLSTFSDAQNLDVTGGGAGRISFYRHFGPRWSLGAGLELGASADFLRDEMGNRASLVFAFDTVVPLVLRYRVISSFYELELGPVGHGRENAGELDPGLHVGIAFGGLALRQGWFVPGAALALSYEQTFPGDGLDAAEPLYLIKIGVRVSIDIDL
jgi:hypothetical protein